MYEQEEKELREISHSLSHIEPPQEIDSYIQAGIKRGKLKKKKKHHSIVLFSNVAVVAIIAVLVMSVHFSPSFSRSASKIPGLSSIVHLLQGDQGIQDAVKQHYIQTINQSIVHDNVTVTVDHVIVDDSKAIIFYSVKAFGTHNFIGLSRVSVENDSGKQLNAGYGVNPTGKRLSKGKVLRGQLQVDFTKQTVLPPKIIFKIKLAKSKNPRMSNPVVLAPTWQFTIPVKNKKMESMKHTFHSNKTVQVDHQKLIVKTVTITPTRIAVEVVYPSTNTKQIFGFDHLAIVDNKGVKRYPVAEGMASSNLTKNHEILYFQSNYFTAGSKLYLIGSGVRALDKNKTEVVVDLKNKKFLQAPKQLELISIKKKNKDLALEFSFASNRTFGHSVLGDKMTDAHGTNFYQKQGSTDFLPHQQRINMIFGNGSKAKGPLHFTIQDYPSTIKGNFKVEIK